MGVRVPQDDPRVSQHPYGTQCGGGVKRRGFWEDSGDPMDVNRRSAGEMFITVDFVRKVMQNHSSPVGTLEKGKKHCKRMN